MAISSPPLTHRQRIHACMIRSQPVSCVAAFRAQPPMRSASSRGNGALCLARGAWWSWACRLGTAWQCSRIITMAIAMNCKYISSLTRRLAVLCLPSRRQPRHRQVRQPPCSLCGRPGGVRSARPARRQSLCCRLLRLCQPPQVLCLPERSRSSSLGSAGSGSSSTGVSSSHPGPRAPSLPRGTAPPPCVFRHRGRIDHAVCPLRHAVSCCEVPSSDVPGPLAARR